MNKRFITQIVRAWCTFAVALVLWSCPSPGQDVLEILEKAIEELALQPSRWKDTMLSAIQQLESSSSELAKTIAAQVKSTYQNILGQTSNEFSCRSDFIANRLQQRLSAIGHAYAPERFEAPEIVPVVCSTNPPDQISADDKLLVYYGYDFLEFEKTNSFTVTLRYADNGEIVLSQAGYVARNTNYQLNVDLQGDKVQNAIKALDKNRGPQFVLSWGNQDVTNDDGQQSALPVLIPAPIPTPIPTLPPIYLTKSFSEEDPGQSCPSGYLINGVKCSGDNCDNLQLACIPYMSGYDSTLSTAWGGDQKWVSDEKNKRDFIFTKGFICGMTCKGSYCDEILPTLMSSSYISNTQECRQTPYFSDENKDYMTCDPDYFVSGLSCRGDYCDEISLTCCRAEVKWP